MAERVVSNFNLSTPPALHYPKAYTICNTRDNVMNTVRLFSDQAEYKLGQNGTNKDFRIATVPH